MVAANFLELNPIIPFAQGIAIYLEMQHLCMTSILWVSTKETENEGDLRCMTKAANIQVSF